MAPPPRNTHAPYTRHLLSIITFCCLLTGTHALPPLPAGYEKRTFTELNPNYWQSADTFSLKIHIKNGTRSQHFRLQGINAPEPNDTREADLLQDSSRFRLPPAQIFQWGNHASQIVQRTLSTGGTIYTNRTPANTPLDHKYTYAIVFDSQGRDLSQLLLEAGLASYDPHAHPLNPSTLQRSQDFAIRARRGIWAQARDTIPAVPVPPPPPPQTASDPIPKLNTHTWTIYTDGTFAPDYYTADGDSFAIKARLQSSTRSTPNVWRLYAVDCPESDSHIPARVRDQAKYFGVDTQTVMTWGKKASRFTTKFLASGPATIYTFREKARGATSKNRYYAIVHVNQQDLALALVKQGLALSGSMPLPGNSSEAHRYRRTLDSAEREARQQKRGIWQHSKK